MFIRRTIATVATAAALLTAIGATATQASADVIVDPSVDTSAMGASIAKALGGGNTVGFAYAIAENGQYATSGSAGKARTGPDGNVNFTSTTRMEIASSTKNFTAVAVQKLIEKTPGLTVNSPIMPFLPLSFQQKADASWDKVTFRHLLNHTSGLEQLEQTLTAAQLAQYNKSYTGVEFAVGLKLTVPSPGLYTNMNYAVLRLIIPRLWRDVEPNRGVPVVSSTNSGLWALNYVNERLLAPAGIAPTSCISANPSTAALAYNVNDVANGGVFYQLSGVGFEQCAGHRGLHLSAMDLVRWQAHLAHGTIISPAVRLQMDSLKLGWRGGSNSGSNTGIYWHDGLLQFNGTELNTCHAKFPGGVEASVLFNSQNRGGVSPCTVLINAYNAGK
ncbi:beta-lactamase family protein [Kribbella sp. NBC_01245]|uniref:serine hydrolase domain-containing protein n=1 Tax=Kribbella sp. NBC_01245 TaxID=2903578 RepID=UPI002E27DCC2|nr:serine hydrolase [Kribbella sp. NBC_01245]